VSPSPGVSGRIIIRGLIKECGDLERDALEVSVATIERSRLKGKKNNAQISSLPSYVQHHGIIYLKPQPLCSSCSDHGMQMTPQKLISLFLGSHSHPPIKLVGIISLQTYLLICWGIS
jgi:hypothetical protein